VGEHYLQIPLLLKKEGFVGGKTANPSVNKGRWICGTIYSTDHMPSLFVVSAKEVNLIELY
jgi:hypothetical protein